MSGRVSYNDIEMICNILSMAFGGVWQIEWCTAGSLYSIINGDTLHIHQSCLKTYLNVIDAYINPILMSR